MSDLNKYTINCAVIGLEASSGDFKKFLKYTKARFGNLLEYKQVPGEPNKFEISVPSDTNLFMIGNLWYKWEAINC